jgi:hypothetical protein
VSREHDDTTRQGDVDNARLLSPNPRSSTPTG